MVDIVVGVDGSEGAKAALRWALAEAEQHDLAVLAVHVYSSLPGSLAELAGYVDVEGLAAEIREEAEALVAGAVEDARQERPGVVVTPVAVDATSPAQALLAHAADARMLVIGTRGHGGVVGMVLGSVSHQCVSHPPCPVTVVPPEG